MTQTYAAVSSEDHGGRPQSSASSTSERRYEVEYMAFAPLSIWLQCILVAQADQSHWARRLYSRGKKDVGVVGRASWPSSVVNLLNTSK